MTEQLLVNGKPSERKTDFSKCYLCLALVLFLGLVLLGGFTYYYIFLRKGDVECGSKECLRASLAVVTSVDNSTDPCKNFHQFICGKYSENNLYLVSEDTVREEKINTLITEEITKEEWPPLFLQKQFYQSCLTQTEEESEAFTKYTREVLKELGGWPIIEHQWDNSKFSLTHFLIKCFELGLPFEWWFRISCGVFSIGDDMPLVQIANPIGIEEFTDPFRTAAYMELIVETVEMFNGSKELAQYQAEKMLDFESRLHDTWKNYDSSEDTPMSEIYLKEIFTKVDVPYLVENVTSEYLESGNSTLIVANEQIIKKLNLLLAGTSPWTLINFVIWKIIQERGVFFASPFKEKFGHFANIFDSKYSDLSKETICLTEAERRFPMVGNFAYGDKYLKEGKVSQIENMVSVIKESFISHLENVQWIADETKPMIKNKIENMKVSVKIYEAEQNVYKNIYNEHTEVITLFGYNTTSFVDLLNIQTLYSFEIRLLFMNATSLDPTQFSENPEYKFIYNDETNEIVLPATVLEDYLYVDDRPQYINYGLLGSIISREMARSLEMDALSGSTETDKPYLWKNDNETSYVELFIRSRCIVDQYIEAGYKIHNDEIFSENYVNLISLDFAYESYLNWVQKNNPEIGLPYVGYSPDKLFWMYYELQFCSQNDDDMLLKYRSSNPIKNSRYFGKVFECQEDSKEEKCIIF